MAQVRLMKIGANGSIVEHGDADELTMQSLSADLISTNTFEAVSGDFQEITADILDAASGNFVNISSESVTVDIGIFDELTTNTVVATSGDFTDFSVDTIQASLGIFDDVTANTVAVADSCTVSGINVSLSTQNLISVKKNPGPNEFGTIKAAMDSITDAAEDNPYVIRVGPGVYVEEEITVKSYVAIRGYSLDSVIVRPDADDHDVFSFESNGNISFITVQNAGPGYAALKFQDTGVYCVVFKVSIVDSDTGIWCKTSVGGVPTEVYLEYVDCVGVDYGLRVETDDGVSLDVNAENFYIYGDEGVNPSYGVWISGDDSVVSLQAAGFSGQDNTDGEAFHIENGAELSAKSTFVHSWGTAINVANVGTAPRIEIDSFCADDCLQDIIIAHPQTTGSFSGCATRSKVTIDINAHVSCSYEDNSGNGTGTVTLGDVLQGDRHSRLANISKLLRDTATMGLVSGGELTHVSGLDIMVAGGQGFIVDPLDDLVREIEWDAELITFPSGETNYVSVDRTNSIVLSPTRPELDEEILLGRVVTHDDVDFIDRSQMNAYQIGNKSEEFNRDAIGPVFAEGSVVTEYVSGTGTLSVSAGRYYFGHTRYEPSGGDGIEWEAYYHVSGAWEETDQTIVDNAFYDNGTDLVTVTSGYFLKHSLYVIGDGADEEYKLVYSQGEYSSYGEAVAGPLPLGPNYFTEALVSIAGLIVQDGVSGIVDFTDERPVVGFRSSATTGTTNHSNLTNLGADDHKQYLLINGSRQMTGDLDMGSNDITDVGTVDGVDVSAHASRHNPGGADAVTTAAPTTALSATTTNATGSASSLARSDHTHSIATGVVSSQTPDQANAAGSSANLARADHVHQIATAAAVGLDTTSTSTQGDALNFARSNHTHAIASGAPSSQAPDQANAAGSSANFAKADHVHAIPTAAAVGLTADSTSTQGDASNFARSNHTHAVATGAPSSQAPDQVNAAGSSSNLTRADHVHQIPTAAPSANLTATTTNAQGSGSSFARNDHSHAITTGAPSSQTPDQANATGSSASLARADHVHQISTAAAVGLTADSTSAQGDAQNFARSNHTHAIATGAPSSQTPDQANAAGSSSNLARADHIHQISTGTPTNVGAANAAGSAATFAKSDHVHRLRYQVRSDRKTGGSQSLGAVVGTYTNISFQTNDLNAGDTGDSLITKPNDTDFTLASAGLYRAGYNLKTDSGNNNTGVEARATLDGTALNQSYDYGETRSSNVESVALKSVFVFQTTGANQVLRFQGAPREAVASSIEDLSTAWVELIRLT